MDAGIYCGAFSPDYPLLEQRRKEIGTALSRRYHYPHNCRRILELPEEKIEEKNASDAVVKKALDKEGKAILSNVRKGAAIVAMCIEGKQISSDELAQFLAQRAGSGAGDVAFVIGSSHGLSDEVKKAAALKFSMGRITMPHQLARLVLTEQIYRACTINAGMKYHK